MLKLAIHKPFNDPVEPGGRRQLTTTSLSRALLPGCSIQLVAKQKSLFMNNMTFVMENYKSGVRMFKDMMGCIFLYLKK